MIGSCRHELEKLRLAEASPVFEAFRELLVKDLMAGLEALLWGQGLQEREEHEMLLRMRTYVGMLELLPGEKLNLEHKILELLRRNEELRERKLQLANAKMIRRWSDLKRQREAKEV